MTFIKILRLFDDRGALLRLQLFIFERSKWCLFKVRWTFYDHGETFWSFDYTFKIDRTHFLITMYTFIFSWSRSFFLITPTFWRSRALFKVWGFFKRSRSNLYFLRAHFSISTPYFYSRSRFRACFFITFDRDPIFLLSPQTLPLTKIKYTPTYKTLKINPTLLPKLKKKD